MAPALESSPYRRSSLRRAVSLDCDVRSKLWDGPAPHRVRDLSPEGLWLDSDLPLATGDALVLVFRPPRWPRHLHPVSALAQVVRVGRGRRRHQPDPGGMGLRFVDLRPSDRHLLTHLLRGLPPPLPRAPRPLPPSSARPHVLTLEDGPQVAFRAEAPLLTAGTARPLGSSPRSVPDPPAATTCAVATSSPARPHPHLRLVERVRALHVERVSAS
jgi:hypothetical protein